MKLFRTPLIATCLVLGFSGLSMAQTAATSPAQASAHSGPQLHAAMQARHNQRLADLKVKLKLDPTQEVSWLAFTQAMQMPKPPVMRPDRAALEKLTTPERLDLMQAHKAQRDALMSQHADATKTFYATLNTDQKKIFDTETARHMNKMGDHMHSAKHNDHASVHH